MKKMILAAMLFIGISAASIAVFSGTDASKAECCSGCSTEKCGNMNCCK